MLARYQIYRGTRLPENPLPDGIRKDTRKHTKHCLRPTTEMVVKYLKNPDDSEWIVFEEQYLKLLETRFKEGRSPFNHLYELAKSEDVYIGCSCPTNKNPDVYKCHTFLALKFMKEKYPDLEVRLP